MVKGVAVNCIFHQALLPIVFGRCQQLIVEQSNTNVKRRKNAVDDKFVAESGENFTSRLLDIAKRYMSSTALGFLAARFGKSTNLS
jgi:hypothetical protein